MRVKLRCRDPREDRRDLARLPAIAFGYCLVFSSVRAYVFRGRRLNYCKGARGDKIAKNTTECVRTSDNSPALISAGRNIGSEIVGHVATNKSEQIHNKRHLYEILFIKRE